MQPTILRINFYFEDITAQVFVIAFIAAIVIIYQVCKGIVNYVSVK